jgi:hypothetical protein
MFYPVFFRKIKAAMMRLKLFFFYRTAYSFHVTWFDL